MEPQDTITIAPSVLIAIVKHAAELVDGISTMAEIPVNVGRIFRGNSMGSGVVLDIDDQQVVVDMYVIVKPDVNMGEVSRTVQDNVRRAIQELVGMDVDAVNVHIADVDYAPAD
ncbi:MAG: Asp23/Gls24 family envelope stress response protein [Anaerolineae bacterium]|nr:Asp23/Gls24 family envelope stress response protein [Anaerolineae bacterium]